MAENHVSPKIYLLVFVALLVLTAITTAAAFVDLGAWQDPVAVIIAVTKASLVVLFFMHAWYSSRLVKMTIVVAGGWLLILIGGTLHDYISRDWLSG